MSNDPEQLTPTCITKQDLVKFVLGTLPKRRQKPFLNHYKSCSVCQRRLAILTDSLSLESQVHADINGLQRLARVRNHVDGQDD